MINGITGNGFDHGNLSFEIDDAVQFKPIKLVAVPLLR